MNGRRARKCPTCGSRYPDAKLVGSQSLSGDKMDCLDAWHYIPWCIEFVQVVRVMEGKQIIGDAPSYEAAREIVESRNRLREIELPKESTE